MDNSNLKEIKKPTNSIRDRVHGILYADDLKEGDIIKPHSKKGLPYPNIEYKKDCNSWVQFDFDNFDYYLVFNHSVNSTAVK